MDSIPKTSILLQNAGTVHQQLDDPPLTLIPVSRNINPF